MNREQITEAEAHLKAADPIMAGLLARQSVEVPAPRSDYFASLARTIIGQQISVASARATAARFEEATGFSPKRTIALTDDQARAAGLSRQKWGYIRDLAQHFVDDPAVYDRLDLLDDADVIRELVAVKGIGEWSAQMFLIFTLGRPDVFAPADVGVQNAMINLYGLHKPLGKEGLIRMAEIAEPWTPYRSVALLHLWQSLYDDPLVVD